MIPEETAFLRKICEEPKENTHRLVYADWLEENTLPCSYCKGTLVYEWEDETDWGTPYMRKSPCWKCDKTGQDNVRKARAELIRIQVELSQTQDKVISPLFQKDAELKRRESVLLPTVQEWIRKTYPLFPAGWQIRRGLIEVIACKSEEFLENAEWLFSNHPITNVQLTNKQCWSDVEDGGSSYGWWEETPFRIEQDGPNDPGNIPPIIFEEIWKANRANGRADRAYRDGELIRWVVWEDEPLIARDELSTACVKIGRRKAGLAHE